MDNQFTELFINTTPTPTGYRIVNLSDEEKNNLDLRLARWSEFWKCKAEIEKKANQGFKYAKKMEKSMGYFKPGMVAFEKLMSLPTTATGEIENLEREVIHLFASTFRTAEFITVFANGIFEALHDFVVGMFNKLSGNNSFGSDLELDVRVCLAFFIFSSAPESVTEIAEAFIRKYPQELFFHWVRCNSLAFVGKVKEAVKAAQKSLKVIPNNYELLFTVVYTTRNITKKEKILCKAKLETSTAAHLEFLKHAPQDHRYKPDIFYSLSCIYITKINMNPTRINAELLHSQVNQYYHSGLQSEKYLLSCFLPYGFERKSLVESYLRVCTVISPEYNRIQLTDLNRVDKIQGYRQFVHDYNLEKLSKLEIDGKHHEEENGTIKKNVLLGDLKVKNQQGLDQELNKLEPIELWDMNRNKDYIYEGRCIKLIIIEDTVIGSLEYIQTLVQDANGEVESCIFYGLDHQDPLLLQERLGYGSSITVMNPHMHLPLDFNAKTCIKVDDPGNIVCHLEEKLEKRCRSCGHDGALQRCGNCKRVQYCNKKCQTQDWKLLKHKLVCNQ